MNISTLYSELSVG